VSAPCAWCRSIAENILRCGRVESISRKIGCVPQTLLEWVKRQEIDATVRGGVTTAEAQRVKIAALEAKQLRLANEILKLASAFFAQAELDYRLKC